MRKKITGIICVIACIGMFHTSLTAQSRRSMWIWNSGLVGNTSSENILLNQCIESGITDLYLYSGGSLLSNATAVRSFISRATCLNIKVWGMDGWRGYFSDLCGPSEYYSNIQDVIDYNMNSAANERFVGFHGDNEFHVNDGSTGCGPGNVFHLGSTDAALSTTSNGIWKASARADRDSLLSDFVKQTANAALRCHTANIEYSIAVMPWITGVNFTNAAMGNQNIPLQATYKGTTKPLFQHLLDYVDEYVIMSYHTNVPGKVVYMCEDVLAYADGMAAGVRPRIMSGLETYCGVGQYVSYCDTPGEDNKAHVMTEIDLHASLMGGSSHHISYTGVAIHDWTGWAGLATVSSNTATPTCTVTGVNKATNTTGYVQYEPSSRQLTINFTSGSGNLDFQLSSISGIKVYNTQVNAENGTVVVTLPFLPQGFYVYQVSFENGAAANGKIIITN